MVENINNSEVNVILNTVMGNDKGIDDIQKQLEKQLELAIKNGSVKGFKDSKKSIARINVGKDWYIASFGVTRDGKYDKRTKVQYSRPLSLQDSKEIYQSRTYRDYQNRLTTKFAEQESKRLSRLERKKQIKERQNIELEKIEEKKQDDRAKKLQFAETWTKIIGGSELDIKKAKLRSLREQLIEIGDDGSDAFQQISKEAENLSVEKNKLEKSLKPSGFQRLLNTIKRVGFYRIARNLFRLIENGFKQGIQNLAEFDSGVNKTMSKLTSNFTTISNSFTVMVVPLIEILQPIIEGITRLVAEIANSINYLFAKLKGVTEYTRINADYMKDFADSANSATLSFDKFESLNITDSNEMFSKESVSNGSGFNDELDRTKMILIEISGILAAVAAYKIVEWIIDGGFKEFFKSFKSGLTDIKNGVDKIGTAGLIASASFLFVTSLINLIDVIKNWDSQSLITKITAITAAVLALAGVIFSILAAIPAIGHATVFKAISVGLIATSTLAAGISVMRFADGGLVDKGSLFIAGEAGAELVTTMPSGQTGVTNVAQFKEAMVEALDEWSVTNGSSSGDIVLNLDGAEIARSKRFNTEMNIRNASLNLR